MFALDLSENYIRVLELLKKRDKFLLNGLGEHEYTAKEEVPKLLRELARVTRPHPLLSKEVAFSIPEEESFTKIVQAPQKEPHELKLFLQEEVSKILPYDPNDIYWDWKIITPLVPGNEHLDVMVVAAAKSVIDSYIQLIKEAGFEPAVVESEPNALLWGVRNPFKAYDPKESFLVVNIGSTKTTIIIFAKGAIRFTTSLKLALSADKKTPDYLAVNWNKWIADNKQNIILTEKNLVSLSSKLNEYIEYYRDHLVHPDEKGENSLSSVIISGAWANFPELLDFLSKKLHVPVKRAENIIPLHPAYTTALGLAFRGLYEEYFSENDISSH